MALAPLPEEILDRFRSSSRNRLTQVASTWKAATLGHASDQMLVEMHRNVHTLKGDARMVQFQDIDLVCQNLEDLLAASEGLQYRVNSDVDLSVSMALDFIGLLLRRRGDQEVSGIDLGGFVSQVHRALRGQSGAKVLTPPPRDLGVASQEDKPAALVSPGLSERLAASATKVFLEYLSAAGVARTRLRGVWRALQHEVEALESVAVFPIAERHAHATQTLATEMGLEVSVELDVQSGLRISAAAAEALEVVLMHSLRNALSHGLAEVGKSGEGKIYIQGRAESDLVLLDVRDQGRGIDVEKIRKRAVSAGIMHPDLAKTASREDLLELLFEPRFTTRDQADDISGRGLGLDVVRDAIAKVAGQVSIDGMPGEGAVLSIRLPMLRRELEIHVFDAYGGRLVLGVPTTWQVQGVALAAAKSPVDPLHRLQVRRPEDETGLTQAGPPQVLRFTLDGTQVDLVAAKSSRLAMARRICPTKESFPAEVVTVDGAEVLLLRLGALPSVSTANQEIDS